jgi:hypothetical protein
MTSRDRRATAETTLKTPPDTVILRAGGMRGDLKPGTAVRDEASASLGSMKMADFRTFGIIGLRAFSREYPQPPLPFAGLPQSASARVLQRELSAGAGANE